MSKRFKLLTVSLVIVGIRDCPHFPGTPATRKNGSLITTHHLPCILNVFCVNRYFEPRGQAYLV